jgi:hypothetical protein
MGAAGMLLDGIAEFAGRRPDDGTPGRAALHATAVKRARAALAADEPADPPGCDEFTADELMPVLRLSKGGAQRQVGLSLALRYRLGATLAALLDGRIDMIRARLPVRLAPMLAATGTGTTGTTGRPWTPGSWTSMARLGTVTILPRRPAIRTPMKAIHPDPRILVRQFLAWLGVTLGPIATISCDHHDAEPGYTPSRKLRHKIHARTPTCSYWGCRRPAAQCDDDDHTCPWQAGGLTCQCNLTPLCRRHHRMKQRQGWQLRRPAPGIAVWRTPGKRSYVTTPAEYAS